MSEKAVANSGNKFDKYRDQFDTTLGKLIDDVTLKDLNNLELTDAAKWIRGVLEYNVKGGKRNRGLMVVVCLDYLKNEKLTVKDINNAVVLGWCVELLQSFFLVADDIVDQSELRRGQPCWYKKPEVGLIAVNDAFLLESCVYKLLRIYFSQEEFYMDIVNSFHEVTHFTALGQELDLLTSQNGKEVELNKFTAEKYNAIVKYKTAFYSFYLPVALAMHLAKIKDPQSYEEAKRILLELGIYFQIQDDYLDCFGDPKETGKIGTDIQEGKCSWLVVKALETATENQREILAKYYGSNNVDAVCKVKDLYRELDLQTKFKEYEEQSHCRITRMIEQYSNSLPNAMFIELVDKIYKRNK